MDFRYSEYSNRPLYQTNVKDPSNPYVTPNYSPNVTAFAPMAGTTGIATAPGVVGVGVGGAAIPKIAVYFLAIFSVFALASILLGLIPLYRSDSISKQFLIRVENASTFENSTLHDILLVRSELRTSSDREFVSSIVANLTDELNSTLPQLIGASNIAQIVNVTLVPDEDFNQTSINFDVVTSLIRKTRILQVRSELVQLLTVDNDKNPFKNITNPFTDTNDLIINDATVRDPR